jgi:protein phosphatase
VERKEMQPVRAAGLTDIGKTRLGNEDAFVLLPEQGLYIVADGMGGHNAGALASEIVVKSLPKMIERRSSSQSGGDAELISSCLQDAIVSLSQKIWTEAASRIDLAGMGATVVVASVQPDQAFIAHMGDSRAYLFRHGELRQLTQDHSVVGILLRQGEITPEEAKHHPARGQVSRYVGMEAEVYPDVQWFPTAAGDRLLMCTDGLTGMVSDSVIGDLLSEFADPERACHALAEAANLAGGKDNITAVIVDWIDNELNESGQPASHGQAN